MSLKSKLKYMAYLMILLFGIYVLVPLIIYVLSGQPSDPAKGGFSGSPSGLGKSCMQARARHTLSFIPDSAIVWEIGVGRGTLAKESIQRGYYYLGIDMDEGLLKELGINFVCCRVPPLPVMCDRPGAIVMESLIEHMRDYDEASALIKDCYNSLEPNGVLIIRAPDIRYAGWRFWDSAPDHAYVTSLRRISVIGRETGFSDIKGGYYIDQFTGISAHLIYRIKSLWPWGVLHNICYQPWQESSYSKIDEKVPGFYAVLKK